MDVEQRIARLERGLRRWQVGSVAAAVALVAMGAAQEPPESLKASRLAIVDEGGAERIVLGLTKGGSSSLILYGPRKNSLVEILGASEGHSTIQCVGPDGLPMATLNNMEGVPQVALYTARGLMSAGMAIDPTLGPSIKLVGKDLETVFEVPKVEGAPEPAKGAR